jgi:competence protein ComGF
MKNYILFSTLILLAFTGCKSNKHYTTLDTSPESSLTAINKNQALNKIQILNQAQINLAAEGYGSSIIGNNILSLKITDINQHTILVDITLKTYQFNHNNLQSEVIGQKFDTQYNQLALHPQDFELLQTIHTIAFGVEPQDPGT